jgi:CBS domain-containing protein
MPLIDGARLFTQVRVKGLIIRIPFKQLAINDPKYSEIYLGKGFLNFIKIKNS